MPETNCPNCGAPASNIVQKRGFAVCTVEPSREANLDAVFSNLQVRAVPDDKT